jgi:hypothetical protein
MNTALLLRAVLASRLLPRSTHPFKLALVKSRALFLMPQLDSCRLPKRQFVNFTCGRGCQ